MPALTAGVGLADLDQIDLEAFNIVGVVELHGVVHRARIRGRPAHGIDRRPSGHGSVSGGLSWAVRSYTLRVGLDH